MKAELKLLWLTALLSGEYAQTQSQLKQEAKPLDNWGPAKPEGYCCLGVLCDVSGVGKWVNGVYFDSERSRLDRSMGFVPSVFASELGLNMTQQRELSNMNDVHHCSFVEIAEWVDEHIQESVA